MIDKNELLKQLDGKTGLWCGADVEGADLAQAIGILTEQGIDSLSVVPGAVATVWPWLEDKKVKIYARFYLSEKRVTEKQISDITVRINNALRQGACGAQIFLRAGALSGLVDQTYVVRDDLFFDKDLSIGLDTSGLLKLLWAFTKGFSGKQVILCFLLLLFEYAQESRNTHFRKYGTLPPRPANPSSEYNFRRLQHVHQNLFM